MGDTFANLQLHLGARGASQAELAEALPGLIADGPPGQQPPVGREVLIGPVGRWAPIYPEADAGVDPAALADLAARLSGGLGTACATIAVDDGDALDLGLFEQGRGVDRIRTWPGHLEGAAKPPPEDRGDPARWRRLLAGTAAEEDLARAWRLRSEVAEPRRILAALAAPLGWDPELAAAGYGSLPEGARARALVVELAGAAAPAPAAGPPGLGSIGGVDPEPSAQVGAQVTASIVAHNDGGPLRGLSVALWGAGLDLLGDPVVRVSVGRPGGPATEPLALAPESGPEGGRLLVAQAEGLAVPAGYPGFAAALAAAGGSYEEAMAAWLACRVEATVVATARGAGIEQLHLGLVPLESPEAGQATRTINLEVMETS